MLSRDLSGIVFAQDRAAQTDTYALTHAWLLQEFLFPTDYRRGTEAGEQRYPALSGFQLALKLLTTDLQLEFKIERDIFGLGWVSQATGAVLTASETGNLLWVDFYLDAPLEVSQDAADDRWRFGIRVVPGAPEYVSDAWVGLPPPLNGGAYEADGVTPASIDGNPVALMFRILALSADEGTDFLGNNFRSVVTEQNSGSVVTGEGSNDDTFWLSKPNPSKFAVENLYFDVRPNSAETHAVIDSVIVDPITPGVYFHVYYSDEGDPESDADAWDAKLWTRVPQTYRALKRERYVLPEPISAKYVKIEFSHLQAQSYDPGNFARPVRYKKHPKWVLDYFLLRYATDQVGIAQRVGVVWNTLDLAYNYYLDDIRQEPDQPVRLLHDETDSLTSFLRQRADLSDQVDTETLTKINLTLKPFAENPVTRANYDYLLGSVVSQQALAMPEYPTETAVTFTSDRFTDVSSLRRERIVFEQSYPVMFFYLTCRHRYRELEAPFDHNRAYFVGIRQVAFMRENYTAAHDTSLYIEATNDQVNLERNDFVAEDGQWVVYSE